MPTLPLSVLTPVTATKCAELGEPVDKLCDIGHIMHARFVFHACQEAGLCYIRRYYIRLFYESAEALGHFLTEICVISAVIGHCGVNDHKRVIVSQKLYRPLEQPPLCR